MLRKFFNFRHNTDIFRFFGLFFVFVFFSNNAFHWATDKDDDCKKDEGKREL